MKHLLSNSNLLEIYARLFFDKFSGTFLLPPHWPYMTQTMIYLGHFNVAYIILIGTAGSSVGAALNWYIGKLSIHIRKDAPNKIFKTEKTKISAQITIQILTLLFAPITPFGGLLNLLSGFASVQLKRTITIVAISNIIYLSYLVAFTK